jgi:hypothetical protein
VDEESRFPTASQATTKIIPQFAAATERHLQLENHAINVVHSKPQQLTKRKQKRKKLCEPFTNKNK